MGVIKVLSAVGIVSNDLKLSISFYKILGLNFEPFGNSEGEAEHWEATTESGVRIMLDSVNLIKTLDPDWEQEQKRNNRIILAFKMSSAEEVDQIFEKFLSSGHQTKKDPWDAFWGQRYASVLDPDGNQIDLFAEIS